MYLTLHHIEKLRPDIWTFWFTTEKRIRYEAGQYIDVTMPHSPTDNRGTVRTLTISSAPQDPITGITVRFMRDGSGSSYKDALQLLEPGDILFATDPIGDFVLPKDDRIPLVFIAAGLGITPIRSMAHYMTISGQKRPVQLVYAVQSPSDLLFEDILANAPIDYIPLVSNPTPEWQGAKGRLSGEVILNLTGDPTNKLFFLSGPQGLIMQIYDQLLRVGIPRRSIVLDYFPGYHNHA